MNKILQISLTSAFVIASDLYAGGTIGGSTGIIRNQVMLESLSDIAFSGLRKVEIDSGLYRRTAARLSAAESETVPLHLEGQEIQIRKLRNKLVDSSLSTELIPAE